MRSWLVINNTSLSFAKAAYRYAKSSGEVNHWRTMLSTIASAVSHDSLAQYLSAPVSSAKKIDMLEDLIALQPKQRVWLKQVLAAKHSPLLQQMHAAFEQLYDQDEKVNTLVVTTKQAVDQAFQSKIADKAKRKLPSPLKIVFCVDEKLLGGITVSYNDRVIDLSFNRILEQLKMN